MVFLSLGGLPNSRSTLDPPVSQMAPKNERSLKKTTTTKKKKTTKKFTSRDPKVVGNRVVYSPPYLPAHIDSPPPYTKLVPMRRAQPLRLLPRPPEEVWRELLAQCSIEKTLEVWYRTYTNPPGPGYEDRFLQIQRYLKGGPVITNEVKRARAMVKELNARNERQWVKDPRCLPWGVQINEDGMLDVESVDCLRIVDALFIKRHRPATHTAWLDVCDILKQPLDQPLLAPKHFKVDRWRCPSEPQPPTALDIWTQLFSKSGRSLAWMSVHMVRFLRKEVEDRHTRGSPNNLV